MARHKDADWDCTTNGSITTADAQLATLMDIRDELKKLNRVFECPNFIAIPGVLRRISRNTAKPRRLRKKV